LLDEVNLASSETLEALSTILESPTSSVVLTERGDLEPVEHDVGLSKMVDKASKVSELAKFTSSSKILQMKVINGGNYAAFNLQHVKSTSRLVFSFVEGPLVQALRSGEW
jgi:midasin (ATPase involved in ribosome maturation)